jgi:hypothetical protein
MTHMKMTSRKVFTGFLYLRFSYKKMVKETAVVTHSHLSQTLRSTTLDVLLLSLHHLGECVVEYTRECSSCLCQDKKGLRADTAKSRCNETP